MYLLYSWDERKTYILDLEQAEEEADEQGRRADNPRRQVKEADDEKKWGKCSVLAKIKLKSSLIWILKKRKSNTTKEQFVKTKGRLEETKESRNIKTISLPKQLNFEYSC